MRKTTSDAVIFQDSWQPNQRRFTEANTHIFDINYDCLRKVFQHLDLTSQFSVLQTHPFFFDVILFDVWYQHYEAFFDVSEDQSICQRSLKFQCEFLQIVLSRFPRINRVPSDIFRACMQLTKHSTFENVVELNVCSYNKTECILHFKDFSKFTHLKTLKLDNIAINYKNCYALQQLENHSIVSSHIINDDDDDDDDDDDAQFAEKIFSSNLKIFDFRPHPQQSVSAELFKNIAHCMNLEELTVFSHCVQSSKSLSAILTLTNLKKFTVYSLNNFHFSPKDHNVFENIFEELSYDRARNIAALEVYGIPEKCFFRNRHIKGVRIVTWSIDKIFHKKSDGCIEWSSDLGATIQAFYKFIATSETLKTLHVCNNIVHRNRHLKDPHFENELQVQRLRLGYNALEIFSKPHDNEQRRSIHGDQSDGFVTFHLHRY